MAQKDPNHDDYCLEQYKHQFQVDLLQGRVAFITGGGSGIGFRMAELLMRHGCHVAIGSRRRDKLQEVVLILLHICMRCVHDEAYQMAVYLYLCSPYEHEVIAIHTRILI